MPANTPLLPTAAALEEGGAVAVFQWTDGHTTRLPAALVRAACPCAGCRHERREAEGKPFKILQGPNPAGDLLFEEMAPVGRYAFKFRWTDGHETGIFTYPFLRDLCPCPECAK